MLPTQCAWCNSACTYWAVCIASQCLGQKRRATAAPDPRPLDTRCRAATVSLESDHLHGSRVRVHMLTWATTASEAGRHLLSAAYRTRPQSGWLQCTARPCARPSGPGWWPGRRTGHDVAHLHSAMQAGPCRGLHAATGSMQGRQVPACRTSIKWAAFSAQQFPHTTTLISASLPLLTCMLSWHHR